jgi:formate-dependent nitrite reductase membrane component NrfD
VAERPSWEKAADFTTQKGPGTACTTYDVPHRRPWGLRVSLYLWTKSLSAGPILVAALLTLFGRVRAPVLFGQVAPALALIFIMLTALLLIGDLERPERFPKILLHPNPRSWLVWGSHILIFYSVIAILWLLFGTTPVYRLVLLLLWPGLVFSVLAAGYSAFLLTQARARELWQSRLLFPHLIIQAFLAGSAMLSLGALYEDSGRLLTDLLLRCLLVGLIVHGILILCEMALSRSGRDAAAAVTSMILGPQAGRFWTLAIFGGIALPIYLLSFYFLYPGPGSLLPVLSCAGVLAGLLVFEDCYMRAGQAPPLS